MRLLRAPPGSPFRYSPRYFDDPAPPGIRSDGISPANGRRFRTKTTLAIRTWASSSAFRMSHQASLRAEEMERVKLYTLYPKKWQCRPHGAMYISRGPSQVRISKEIDPVTRQITAWHAEWLRSVDNPYFMDGRPRPSQYAAHTWGGFSTAEFVGEMLKITTTHLKEDYYRRNGVPSSDQATLTQYWIRRGDILTWVTIAYDPLYLTEPMIRSSEYRLALNQQIPPYPCTVVEEVDAVLMAWCCPATCPGRILSCRSSAKNTRSRLRQLSAARRRCTRSWPGKSSARKTCRGLSVAGERNSTVKTLIASAVLFGAAALSSAQTIEIVPVRGHIYLLAGAGANITLSVGVDGVFMVDAGLPQMTDQVLAAIRKLSQDLAKEGQPLASYAPPKPVRYLANTTIFSRTHRRQREDRRIGQNLHRRKHLSGSRQRSDQRRRGNSLH